MQNLIVYSVDASSRDAKVRKDTLLVLLLMIDIPHYLEDPKQGEKWYIFPYYG